MVDDEPQGGGRRTGTYRDQRFSSTNSRPNSIIHYTNEARSLTRRRGQFNLRGSVTLPDSRRLGAPESTPDRLNLIAATNAAALHLM